MNGYPTRSCTSPGDFSYFMKFNVRNPNFITGTIDTSFLGGIQYEQPSNYSWSSSTSTSPTTSPRHQPVYNSVANNFYINEHPKTHTNTSQALPASLSNLVHFPPSSSPGFLTKVYNNIGYQHPTAQIQSTHAPAPYPSHQVFYVKPSATSSVTSRTASPENEILESSDPSIAEAAIHQITFDSPPTNYPTQFISSFTSPLSSDLAKHTTGNFTKC